jgi:hypothetical protein
MTNRRRFALALAPALLLAARPAAACDDDRPVRVEAFPAAPAWGVGWVAPPAHAATVALVLPPVPAWLSTVVPPPPPWAPASPRALARHYRWLDGASAAFHARWGRHPGHTARFEAWERAYRAGLDRQWILVARAGDDGWRRDGGWRGHGRGHGRHGG